MKAYRCVEVLLWKEPRFIQLSDDGKLVYFHLYTNGFTTSLGIYAQSMEGLAADIGWTIDRYRKPFRELLTADMVRYDDALLVVWLPGFFEAKHNLPKNANELAGRVKVLESIPDASTVKGEFLQSLIRLRERLPKGCARVVDTVTGTVSETVPDTQTEKTGTTCNREPGTGNPNRKGEWPRATRTCPEDFELDDADRTAALDAGMTEVEIERQLSKFRRYHFPVPHKRWHDVWRNWVLRADDFTPQRGGKSVDPKNWA